MFLYVSSLYVEDSIDFLISLMAFSLDSISFSLAFIFYSYSDLPLMEPNKI